MSEEKGDRYGIQDGMWRKNSGLRPDSEQGKGKKGWERQENARLRLKTQKNPRGLSDNSLFHYLDEVPS